MPEPNRAPSGHHAEWEILLASGTAGPSTPFTTRIEALARQDLDWDWLVQASLRHGMMPLLHQTLLTACPEAVPRDTWQELEQLYQRNVLRTLQLTGELLRCLDHLAAHGIVAIPYKGPALASLAYGDVALRQYADLDILVRQPEALSARNLLVSQGYRLGLQLNAAQEAAFLRAQSAYALTRQTDALLVELHWRFFEAYFCSPLVSEELWERAVPISLLGREVLSLAPEDLLPVLCLHGTKHGWQRLGWVCDIAKLLNANRDMEWPAILEQVHKVGSVRMLRLGLRLAHDCFQAPIPDNIATIVHADEVATALARQVRDWHLQDVERHSPSDTGLWRFHLQARERWADRARYVVRLALTPTVGDWRAIPLPAPLFPLYFLLRPFRLSAAYGSDRLKRALRC